MKNLFFALLTSTLGMLVTYSQQTNHTINVGGINRSYIQYLPVGYDPQIESLPILFVLHGLGGTASSITTIGMNNIADAERIIVVYPQGSNNSFGQPSWNNGTQLFSSQTDDVGFFEDLMDMYLTSFNGDISRIYVSGFSMGGIMSYHLACALNERIAAIASLSGTMSTSDIQSCIPDYKTPVIHMHGTNDATVPYNTNPLVSLSLVPETITFWKNVNGCATTYDSIRKTDSASDGITVDQFIYDGCENEGSLELWRLNNAGHIYLQQPTNDISQATEVWAFLKKWSRPMTASLTTTKNNEAIKPFPNPSDGKIRLQGIEDSNVSIYNTNGCLLKTYFVTKESEINLTDLSPGIYFVKATSLGQPIRIVIE